MGNRADHALLTDADLEAALRDLGRSLAVPAVATLASAQDPARRARLRIEEGAAAARPRRRWTLLAPTPGRRLGRGLVLAALAVVVVAAIAGAIGLGLPGIRIVAAPTGAPVATFPGPTGSPSTPSPRSTGSTNPTSSSPTGAVTLGADLGLGDPIAIADIDSAVDIPVVLPSAPGVGAPATAWLRDGRLSLVWATNPTLPASLEPRVGLLLGEFRGSLDPGYFLKIVGPDTAVTPVTVDGVTGYWISGAPHEIVFVGADGSPVFDSRRSVGDTLLWARGDVTYRLESGLDHEAALVLAESLR